MAILLGWGVGNVVVGVWRQFHPSVQKRCFWQMNLGWGLVNSLIAAMTLYLLFTQPLKYSDPVFQALQINIIAFNVILDFIYVVVGRKLTHTQKKHYERTIAYGWSIIIQGMFLLALDVTLVVLLLLNQS